MNAPKRVDAPAFYTVSGWRKLVVGPLALLLRLWFASWRFEFPEEITRRLAEDPRGMLVILWHNRLIASAEMHRRLRRGRNRGVALISGSRDGAWLAALFNLLGVDAVRGSQNRRAVAGAREALGILRAGYDTGITVDGSRGPVYEAKEGAALLAMRSGAPLLFFSPNFGRAWRFRSWDRFYLPLPFSRITCRMEWFENLQSFCPEPDRKTVTTAITTKLRQLAEGSDPELGL